MEKHAGPYDLARTFVHLSGAGASEPVPVTDTFWRDLGSGRLPQLTGGRLISHAVSSAPWLVWEMHPNGDEVVVLLAGAADFVLEDEAGTRTVALRGPGSFVIVPRGVWHTARPLTESRMLFVTPGEGTRHRPVARA